MIHCDINKCVGCRMCEVTCSSFHFGAVSPAMSRIRVAKLEATGIDMAVSCYSCIEKPCMDCPEEALYSGTNGEVILLDDLCTSCEQCVEACPVGAVGFYEDWPLFCDLCGGEKLCIESCPNDALSYHENNEVSLKEFMSAEGKPNQKRSEYVNALGKSIRESWIMGARVDS